MRNLTNNAKITPTQVLDIKRRYQAGGITQAQLGREYGISVIQIGRIVRGESWAHIGRFAGISPVDIQASMERFLAMQGKDPSELPTSEGMARLENEAAFQQARDEKAEKLLDELIKDDDPKKNPYY